ncbi:MAG: hypothetical protein FD167_3378 [bacterium]|nr:MAG: hypothetical protein FD167_3378 [bacterium]
MNWRKSHLAMLLVLLVPQMALAQGFGLSPNAERFEIIKYTAIFIVSCIVVFFLLIRLTIIPFLVKNYYSLSDATHIGISLLILYSLNLFTLIFFRLYTGSAWRAIFVVIAAFWFIHLLLKVILSKRGEE